MPSHLVLPISIFCNSTNLPALRHSLWRQCLALVCRQKFQVAKNYCHLLQQFVSVLLRNCLGLFYWWCTTAGSLNPHPAVE
jgi:hypothetical protein